METHSEEFPVMSMARVLEVSRSGYYKYLKLKNENKSRYPAEMLEKVYTIWLHFIFFFPAHTGPIFLLHRITAEKRNYTS
jgi:hypothetical protein